MAATIRCPKCKTEQPKQPICANCGFDIRAYALKLRQQKAAASPTPSLSPGKPTITCPKCKTEQPKQPICANCGFDIRAYVLRLKQKAPAQPQQPKPQPPQAQQPKPQPPQAQQPKPQPPQAQQPKPQPQQAQQPKPQPPQPPEGRKLTPNLKALDELRKKVAKELPQGEALKSVADLFSESWEVYKRRLGPLIALYLLSIVFTVIPMALFVGGGIGLAAAISELKWIFLIVGSVLGVTFALIGMCWGLAALIAGVVNERLGIKDSLGRGWNMLWPYIWLISLAWYVITGATLLLFIPGLIFLVWAFPSQFVIFTEKERGMNALLKSREYVRGYWMDTFIKLFIIWLGMLVASFVPFGQLLFFPFVMIYLFKMFMNLRRIKGSIIIYPTTVKAKLVWLGTGTLGLLLPIVLIIVLAGPMLSGTLSTVLKEIGSGPFPGQPGHSGQTASKGLVVPSKDAYVTGEPVVITYSSLPGNQRDWITIVEASTPDDRFAERFFTQGNTSGQHVFSGLHPGTYELRVYYDWPDGGYIVRDRYRITVSAPSVAQ